MREIESKELPYQTFQVKEWITAVFVEADDPDILDIFFEEKAKAGLQQTDIRLFVPEAEDGDNSLGYVAGSREHGYNVTLQPRTLQAKKDGEGWVVRYVLRHEFAHIKNGDCDIKLPRKIKELVSKHIQEPRACRYARKMFD